jgi:molybdenum cofactor cytidylyltransferase
VLGTWRASSVDRLVMVVHPDDRDLARIGRRLGATVLQPESAPGEMKESVRIALAHLAAEFNPAASDAWLLAPADMPTLQSATIDRLVSAYRSAEPAIWAPVARGRRGHPVLFPWSLAAEVARLGPGEDVRALLARHPVRTIRAVASSILEDLDTPQQYERLRRRARPE